MLNDVLGCHMPTDELVNSCRQKEKGEELEHTDITSSKGAYINATLSKAVHDKHIACKPTAPI